MSDLQQRPPHAETLQVWRLHRLLRFSECRYTRPLSASARRSSRSAPRNSAKGLETGLEVTLRGGRFGPYVQLGEGAEGEKPKRASLRKGMAPDEVTLEVALKLLSLPREVGRRPEEDGEPIRAACGGCRTLCPAWARLTPAWKIGDDVFAVGLNRAVTLIAEKMAKGPRRRFGAEWAAHFGDHPSKGGPNSLEQPLRPLRESCQHQRYAAGRDRAFSG